MEIPQFKSIEPLKRIEALEDNIRRWEECPCDEEVAGENITRIQNRIELVAASMVDDIIN